MCEYQAALEDFRILINRMSKETALDNEPLLRSICKKVNEKLATPASSLLDVLESPKTKTKIQEYLQKAPLRAVRRSVNLADLDLRLLDVQYADDNRDDQTKFRKMLGERSLGSQYHEWEMQKFNQSRLDDLRRDIGVWNAGEGNIAEFIKAQGFPQQDFVKRAIRNGTRLLLLDHLFGADVASAVVSFVPTRFQKVAGPELKGLADSMRKSEWLVGLIAETQPWFLECQAIYTGQ